jgi:DNA polymerase III epsilon subunit-like protein
VRNARAIGQVIRDFAAWFDHATCLVAHNAPFDAAFLVSALDKHEINGCAPIIMDTLAWCRSRGLPTVNNKLQTLLEYIEAPMEGLHRAAADAHGAMFLMLYLAKTSPNIDDELAVYPMPIRDYAPGRARPTKPKSKAAKGNEIRIEFNLEDLVKDSTPTPRESESGTRPPEITIDTQAFAWRDEPASLKQGRFLESLGTLKACLTT